MSYVVPHLIDGKREVIVSDRKKILINPATGEHLGEVFFANAHTVNLAVNSAKKAFKEWSQTPPIKRARILFEYRALLIQHQKELAEYVMTEHGKTFDDAMGSISRAIEVVEHHAGIVKQLQGSYTLNAATDVDCVTIHQPLGICAGVSPFNFPVMVPVWMMIPAIACGNAFILKPSEQDPTCAVRLVELLHEAGLPKGVVNVLQGDKAVVDMLLNEPDIQAFTAVASTNVARYIYQEATKNGKRAHTFGGAKNHAVILPDADMEEAAKAITGAAYGSAGERCMAISVVVTVGNQTKLDFLQAILPKIQGIRVGKGDDSHVDMGPLISESHRARVLSMIETGVSEGATLLIDGTQFQQDDYPNGNFLGPCLFDGVTENMSIYQEEIFGPVLCLMSCDTLDEAIDLVNRHPYGNGTAIFTRDGYSARTYAEHIQAGMVGVNIPIPVPIAYHPFGGWKSSVFGDTNMHGDESIHFYTRRKTITSRWQPSSVGDSSFIMPTHN